MLQHQSLCHVILTPLLSSCLWRAGSDRISYIYARNIQWRKNVNLSTCPHDMKGIGAKVVYSLGAKINEPTPRRNNFIGSLRESNAGKVSVLSSSFPPAESTDTTDILHCWHYASYGGAPCSHQARRGRWGWPQLSYTRGEKCSHIIYSCSISYDQHHWSLPLSMG